MPVLGVTGGSNVGKSKIVTAFQDQTQVRKLGCNASQVALFDADGELARLYAEDPEVIGKIGGLCPEAVMGGKVNKKRLAEFCFTSDENLGCIQVVTIDKIRASVHDFIQKNPDKLVILDMPLLIDIGLHTICDAVVLVTADYAVREARAITRMREQRGYGEGQARTLFQHLVRSQSGLPKQERDALLPEEAARLGDERKREALARDNIPYVEIDNSAGCTPNALLDGIKSGIGGTLARGSRRVPS